MTSTTTTDTHRIHLGVDAKAITTPGWCEADERVLVDVRDSIFARMFCGDHVTIIDTDGDTYLAEVMDRDEYTGDVWIVMT